MNILIVGSNAREHIIAKTLHRSPQQPQLFCCGTHLNPGIKEIAANYWIGNITDIAAITQLARQWQIDLAIIGPEAPLEKGLADALWAASIAAIGPKQCLAQLETSKGFARRLMQTHQVKGLPRYSCFPVDGDYKPFLMQLGEKNYVIKADGLMGGKGVKVAGDHLHSYQEAIAFCEELLANGQAFIIEEKLIGQEFSLMCFCDGSHLTPMPLVQDHKRAFVGDKGPNTGGMGSYSADDHQLPFLTQRDIQTALEINQAIIKALHLEYSERFIGILYGSFIAARDGIYVIEFNVRFGDPEVLNVLSILETDLLSIFQALVSGQLAKLTIRFANQATVCKYAVPEGYPEAPRIDEPLDLTEVSEQANLYFASVKTINHDILTSASRAIACVGMAATLNDAEAIAEKNISAIKGPLYHREDIGKASLIEQRIQMMQQLRMT